MTRFRRIAAAIIALSMFTAALPAEAGGYRHGGGSRVDVHVHSHGSHWHRHGHHWHEHRAHRHKHRGHRHHRDRHNSDFDKIAVGIVAGAIIGGTIAAIANRHKHRR